MLKEVIAKMDPKDAAYHMKRCVDSGLWVPDAKTAEATEERVQEEDTQEETYATVGEKS